MLETVNDARSGKGSFSYEDHASRLSVVSPDETLRINYRDHMLPPFAGSEPVDRAETLSTKSTTGSYSVGLPMFTIRADVTCPQKNQRCLARPRDVRKIGLWN